MLVPQHFVDQQQAVAVALFADSDDASTSLPGSYWLTDPHAEKGTVHREPQLSARKSISKLLHYRHDPAVHR